MICADTNIFVSFFRSGHNSPAKALQTALDERQLMMNPFVLSELLSSPKLPKKTEKYLLDLPRLEFDSTFFERAGFLRRKIYEKGKGVAIVDVYIAQVCIDNAIPLLTMDHDQLLIAEHSSLKVDPVNE